jgi:hypothetical protein
MDNQTTTTQIENDPFAEAFEGVPDEVKSFMFSEAFTITVDAIQKALSLTDDQKTFVRYGAYELLLQTKTMDELAKWWADEKLFAPDMLVKVLYYIHTEILTPAQNITNFFTDSEESTAENNSANTTSAETKANISDMLKNLSNQSGGIGATTRDYSATAAAAPVPKKETLADPYHEPIE